MFSESKVKCDRGKVWIKASYKSAKMKLSNKDT